MSKHTTAASHHQTDRQAQADQAAGEAVEEQDVPHTATPPATSQRDLDQAVLHACLSRLSRLMGYQDEHMPDHVSDIDISGVSEKYAGITAFAKGAKLP